MRLTPTSFIVLGLVEAAGKANPYELKAMAKQTVGNFWSLQHAQLYTEPEKLAQAGYLTEEREEAGRRRKQYAITKLGREALQEWREEPTTGLFELRDLGLLKLFFGADPAALAAVQVEAHRGRLAEYQALHKALQPDCPEATCLVLEAGIALEKEWVRFWSKLDKA